MPFDKHLAGGYPDERRIDPRTDKQVEYWAERFGISPDELREVVGKVGSEVSDITNYLRGQGRLRGI